ncbi:esterase family protein [Bacillus sp. V3B]|uniref:alpha/beta hydrolase n=1 Tax=Bacillus sp. V3B TaxID=2804915 RepID=UPI00210EDA67|nr:esterase family protein [Bacillus sp. V3B]MCQ6274279.1 esterase family protein [Bacillus sp. V3B]
MNFPRGSIQDIPFYSKELGEDINLLIYLPASYSPLYKYHLLIAQDGLDYFQLGRIGRVADELLFNQEIDNLIIVGIPYKNVEDRWEKYHPNGEQQKEYIRFLAHELIPYLDREYSTYQMGFSRSLIGDSLAATVSFMAAIQYPHTFGHVIMQSPFVNNDVLKVVAQTKISELNIYHIIGVHEIEVKTTEGIMKDFLTPNRKLFNLLKKKNSPYFYEEFAGNHTWKYWQPDLTRALKHIFN